MRRLFLAACCVALVAFASPASAAPDKYSRTAEELSQAIATYQKLNAQQEKYEVAFRRDPLRPLVDAQGNLLSSAGLHDGLWVQGIIWSPERPLAVIEGELFGPGDTLDQYTILEVRQDGVLVQGGNGETEFIPMERESAMTKAAAPVAAAETPSEPYQEPPSEETIAEPPPQRLPY